MTEAIHPTAVVDPRARLGARVRIGAYTVVGPDAVLADDVELGHHVVVEGRVELGERVRIGHGCILGGAPQDLKFQDGTPSGVRIGERTVLREHVTVHRATAPEGWTQIGRDGLIMGLAHVAHDCRLGDGVIVINYAGITGHCEIGDRATIGGLTGMVPFTRVGTAAYVGGMAKVNADVPPYMIVDGQPATVRGVNVVGLRRAGIAPAERRALQDAYRLLYRSGLAPKRGLDRVREDVAACPPVLALIDFIVAATRHGICGPPAGGSAAGDEPAWPAEAEESER
ncbi:MAG TPA: acyl-ACP--UDP-N-acetylglucosamine O-acyltransferase [Methylomirabilota bacterium]